MQKAIREGKPIADYMGRVNQSSEVDKLLKRMNQPMLLVKAEAIQELHDSYQNIIDQ